MRTFGIAELAERSGLTPGVLRTWEQRFGFPTGARNASGHRRFTDSDLALVQQVTTARATGLPLALAIDSVLQQHRLGRVASVFGMLTSQFPQLRPVHLQRRTLLHISRAIEDECLSKGDRPLLLGAFQTAERFAHSAARWSELARTACWSAVVADLSSLESVRPLPATLPVLCNLSPDSPMRREWSVICVGSSFTATLSAWQIPAEGEGQGRYEAVVSSQPAVALAAAHAMIAVLDSNGTPVPTTVTDRLSLLPGLATNSLDQPAQAADTLLARVLTNLDNEQDLR